MCELYRECYRILYLYLPIILSKIITLKLEEDIFHEAEDLAKKMDIPLNTYINQAVAFYTRLYKRGILKKEYKKASLAVMANSMKVLKEFEAFTEDMVVS